MVSAAASPLRFEVHLIDLDPTQGSEIRKTRPCVVVSPDEMNRHLRTVIVAPMTSTAALPTGLRGSLPPRRTLPRRSHSTVCRLPQTWLEPRPPSASDGGSSTVWPIARNAAAASAEIAPGSAPITSGSHWWW